MKTAAFAMGMLAAVANAAAYPRIHARFDNSTAIAEQSASTTLTVIQTNTQTITSCKPTITNCPAKQSDIDKLPESDKEPVIVTNTVVLTTTVCPVEDVPKISSSVVQDADNGIITGSTVTLSTTYIQPDVPEKTETPEKPVEGGDNSAEHGEETPKEEEKPEGDSPKEDKPKKEEHKTEAPKEEPTTTTTATSTSTRYITLAPKPEETGSENSPETGSDNGTGKGEDNGKDNGNGKGEECVPETVTVTAPASTVYVTVGGADKTHEATTKPTDKTGGDNSAEEGEEIPEDCIPEDEEEDDEEDTEDKHEETPAEDKPEDEKPAEDGDNSPVDGADGSGCDLETASSELPAETSSASIVYPPAVETPAATPVIPGGEGDFVTTSIMPSAATPGAAKPTGFYRVRR